jgi:threonine/homoserine/homoserine lactone efflux protein
MIDWSLILSALAVHFLALISPGPDFIVAVQSGLSYQKRKALSTALGFGAGIAVHITYCAIGVGYLVSQSLLLFNTLKLIGGLYLLWIAIQLLRSQGIQAHIKSTYKETSHYYAFRKGFLTNVLNPKATLFMVSLFSFILTPTTSFETILLASLCMILLTIFWFSLVILFVSFCKEHVTKYSKFIDRTSGLALLFLSLKLLMSKR